MEGNAMDDILYPGPGERSFANGGSFSAHVRHGLIHSVELPAPQRLAALGRRFKAAHEAVDHRAATLRAASLAER
jgi:hypothetical protein